MKGSHLEVLRVMALKEQAETVAKLEESVRTLIGQVNDILATVTEIRENLPGKAKGKAKPNEDAVASE